MIGIQYNRCVPHAGVMELADVVDSKSTASDGVPVRVRPPAPKSRLHPNGCRRDFYVGGRLMFSIGHIFACGENIITDGEQQNGVSEETNLAVCAGSESGGSLHPNGCRRDFCVGGRLMFSIGHIFACDLVALRFYGTEPISRFAVLSWLTDQYTAHVVARNQHIL